MWTDPYRTTTGADTELGQLAKTDRNPIQENRYQELLAQAEANDPVKQAEKKRLALEEQQRARQDEFLGRFRTAVEGQEKLPDMAARLGGELGLPGLRSTSQGLMNTLEATPETQKTATRGYNVNSNQLARIIGAKQAELAPSATKAAQNTLNAENELGTRLGYGVQQQVKDLTPFTTEQSLMSDQLAREYTGFTQQASNELQMIMQQIQNNQAVTLQQMQNANNLAIKKLEYDNAKNSIDKYLTLSEGQTVYDPTSLQALYTAPKTYKPTGGGGKPS